MDLTENIKKIREKNRISQTELAKRLGVEPTNYPRIEKRGNNLTYEYIELLANALEVPVYELLGFSDKSKEVELLKIENENLKKVAESANNRVREFEVRASMFDKIEQYYLEELKSDIDTFTNHTHESYAPYFKLLDSIENEEERFNSLAFFVFLETNTWYDMAIDTLSVLRDIKLIYAWERFNYINPLRFTMRDFQETLGSYQLFNKESAYEMIDKRVSQNKYKYHKFEIDLMKEYALKHTKS